MRFAITATDAYLGVFTALVEAGWTPVKLFTTPVDNRLYHNKDIIAAANSLDIPIQVSPIQERDLADLGDRGCDVLVVASYNWLIRGWEPHLPYAVNFHASLLPEGRGPYPQINAILEQHKEWGITCHKLTERFDSGEILAQEGFPMSPDESLDSLSLKIELAGARLADHVARNFDPLWQDAKPQGEGSYYPLYRDSDRVLDFNQPVADILRRIRAFGEHECLARLNDVDMFVRRAVGWQETHDHPPGTLVVNSMMRLVVAADDGYVGILEWSLSNPDMPSGRIGR